MLKKYLPWVLKIALTGALFWYLLGRIDLADAWAEARSMDPWLLLAAAASLLVQVPIGAVRWRAVLRSMRAALPFGRIFSIYYIGCFFNLALPSSVGGDAIRMWKARSAGLSLQAAVNSVMLERVATVLGLVLLVAAMQPILIARLGDLPGAWVFPALSVAGVLGVLALTLLDRLPGSLQHWKLVRGLGHLAQDARRVFLNLNWAPRIIGWVLLGHLNLTVTVWLLAKGLGLGVDLLDCLALVPPVILVATLPISVSGWGVRETAMVTAFAFVGVAAPSALAMSILFGVLVVLTSLPGGLFWLAAGGGGWGEMRGLEPDKA